MRAQDGFWVIYQGKAPVGEVKGIHLANLLVDRLKGRHSGHSFRHATYPTSEASFRGRDRICELLYRKPSA